VEVLEVLQEVEVVLQVVIENHCATTSGCYTASPLATPTSLPVSVQQAYPITIGAGGADAGDQVPPAPAPSARG
jgi:hypothetical protein